MAIALWFVGFVGLLVATAVATARGRAHPHDVAGRGVIAVAAVAYAGIVAATVWVWGGSMASEGRADRLRQGATVGVTLDGVRILDTTRPLEGAHRSATIGHGLDATLRIPGEGLDTVARVELGAKGAVTVRAFDNGGADTNGASGANGVGANGAGVNGVGANGAGVNAVGANGDRSARLVAIAGREDPVVRANAACAKATSGKAVRAVELPLDTSVVVVECAGNRGVAGLVVRRDSRGVVGMPLVAERGRLVVERRSLHAGDAVRVGSATDPIPNLVTWEVTAPASSSAMLAIPIDPADCSAWSSEVGTAREVGLGCAVTAGAFELTAMPLIPDAEAVVRRNALAAIVIGAPALLLLLVVALSPRHGRKTRVFGRALRVCVLGAGLVALACWRLVWAHRIDAMHEAGWRTRDNELAVIAIGAALAGCVVLSLDVLEGRSFVRRVAAALLAWGAWLLGWMFLAGVQPPLTMFGAGVIGLSALAALTPVLGDLAGRIANRVPPELQLLAIAGGALAARSFGVRSAIVKLGLAYATVLAGHAALRALLTRRSFVTRGTKTATDDADDTIAMPGESKAANDADDTIALRSETNTADDADDTVALRSETNTADDADDTVALRSGEPNPAMGDEDAAIALPGESKGTDDADDTIALRGGESVDEADEPSTSDDDASGERRTVQRASTRDDDDIEDSLPVARWRHGLRRVVELPPTWARDVAHRALLICSLIVAVGAVALLDAGVTLAIVGVGLSLAMLVAGHDAMYDTSQSGKLGLLEREHARLLVAHGVAVAGLAIGVATTVLLASDRELLDGGALAVLHAPLVVVGLFGIAAAIARSHRRAWAPWLAAALAALAVWGMRDAMLERATAGEGVASRRVAAVVDPGYALLRDDHAFVANATAWREAAVAASADTFNGQGYFGARIRDTGVLRSIENDYLPVLVAREGGVGGLTQTVLLLLALVVGAGAIASLRLPHASRAQRARWLVTGVGGALVVYQPLAALGVLPLTGITWPGLGIDSPGDLWLFVIGLVWCVLGAEQPAVSPRASDERVRRVPRVARARRVVLVALVLAGLAAVVVVVRAGAVALSRVGDEDTRVTTALRYASSLACASETAGASFDEAIPSVVSGRPTDGSTARYERDASERWRAERAALLKALEPKAVEKPIAPIVTPTDEKTTAIEADDTSIPTGENIATDVAARFSSSVAVQTNRRRSISVTPARLGPAISVTQANLGSNRLHDPTLGRLGAGGSSAFEAPMLRDPNLRLVGDPKDHDANRHDSKRDGDAATKPGRDDASRNSPSGRQSDKSARPNRNGAKAGQTDRPNPDGDATVKASRDGTTKRGGAKAGGTDDRSARPNRNGDTAGHVDARPNRDGDTSTTKRGGAKADRINDKSVRSNRDGGQSDDTKPNRGGAKAGKSDAAKSNPARQTGDKLDGADANRDPKVKRRGGIVGTGDAKRGAKPKLGSAAKAAKGESKQLDDDDIHDSDALARILDLFNLPMPAPEPLACPGRVGSWRFAREGDACVATLSLGWPDVKLTLRRDDTGVQARCAVSLPDDAVSALRTRTRTPRERIRVVSAPIGASVEDVGEVVLGARIVRLRAGAPKLELPALAPGVHVASEVSLGDATIAVRAGAAKGIVLRGAAELFVAEAGQGAAWRKAIHAGEVGLERISLVSSGPADRRAVALVRPPRAWAGAAPVVDSLVGDTAGDRVRRVYPHGAAMPELGWVNPYDVERSLGLDGWIHAWAARGKRDAAAPACGTLAPPAIATESICSKSPLDGVMECRVALQPQLALELRGLAARILAEPKGFTGRDIAPVRVAFVAIRGDTGELLAQGNLAAGKPALAFAPTDARAEAELVKLRDQAGEADVERVDWNLPIAVGSTFKPIVARAAEQAFPSEVAGMSLTAAGHGTGCRAKRGIAIDPIVGHCPPTSLSSIVGMPTTADVHEFLAKSPNWFQAALGLVGLGLGDAKMTVKDQQVSLVDIAGSDLASWPTDSALSIADPSGPILGKRNLTIAGLRRTPMWTRIEALLGRPVCTLGDRASCERVAARADVCAARGLPIASPSADLRNLIALGPDRIDLYASDRKGQSAVPVREYLQLLRGSGVHAIGSLAQITDAFGRVVFDAGATSKLAASWFPAPATGAVPAYTCAKEGGRANTVLGADGGLCGVVRDGGTGQLVIKELANDPSIVIYGAKTGTIDSLADIARSPRACARWNATHVASARLTCGKAPPDDSLFVIAFGVVTPKGTIPITLGIQLQRAGKSGATKAVPSFMRAIAAYLRG